jgi:HKD family nuclease
LLSAEEKSGTSKAVNTEEATSQLLSWNIEITIEMDAKRHARIKQVVEETFEAMADYDDGPDDSHRHATTRTW